MYCPHCDWPFSPRKDGKIPKHVGSDLKFFSTQQSSCGMSGKPAERGLRKPLRGDSKTMRCAGCNTRKMRGKDGRINTHKRHGESCPGGRQGR